MNNLKRLLVVGWLPALILAVLMIGCADDNGGTIANCDTSPPTVISTVPVNDAAGVSLSGNITATFSEAMDPSAINTSTMTLTTILNEGMTPASGVDAVSGTVTYTGMTATFNPASDLAPSTVYSATVTNSVKDEAGNAMVNNYVWSFTTEETVDVNPPTVISTVPDNDATDASLNGNITATFSEAMDPSTITTTTFMLRQGTTPVSGTVAYTGVTASFNPAGDLTPSTLYTATITTGVKDVAGNAMVSNYVWSFTTGTAADVSPPTVDSTIPENDATGVSLCSMERHSLRVQ
jgi:hypothetical protein